MFNLMMVVFNWLKSLFEDEKSFNYPPVRWANYRLNVANPPYFRKEIRASNDDRVVIKEDDEGCIEEELPVVSPEKNIFYEWDYQKLREENRKIDMLRPILIQNVAY